MPDPQDLTRLKNFVAERVGSNNPDLDTNEDSWRPIAGKTVVLADLTGPGMVTHIWLTVAANEYAWPRLLRLRVYYDGSPTRSCPSRGAATTSALSSASCRIQPAGSAQATIASTLRSAFEERADLFSRVAFWYQAGIAADQPRVPFGSRRLPIGNARPIEGENSLPDVSAEGGKVSV